MNVYRGYDQAGLDAQYNNRARVPSHGDDIARWERTSARVRETQPAHLDLAYGDHPRHRVDIFPVGESAPLLLFIHGGYWQALDKSAFSFPAPAFTAAGIAYAAPSYPLAPDAGLDAIVASLRDAIAWLWRSGAAHGIDPDRIFVTGHSAGGHLTAMMMATDWSARGAPADLVKGGCPISGLYDLEPIRLSYLNAVLGMDAASAERNSPIHLPPTCRGAGLIAVGGDESDEFHRQQSALIDAWSAVGPALTPVDMPGKHHFDIVDALADTTSALFQALRDTILAYKAK